MSSNSEETRWKQFGKWLRLHRKVVDLTQEQVALRAGIHVLQVGRIEKGESGTKRDTVIALAKAINADYNEALTRAGFAPIDANQPMFSRSSLDHANSKLDLFQPKTAPKNIAEFLAALEAMGLEQFTFAADRAALENYGPEDFEELLERIKADVEITIRRKAR